MKNVKELLAPISHRGGRRRTFDVFRPSPRLSENGVYTGPMEPGVLTKVLEPVVADRSVHASIVALRGRVEADDKYRRVIEKAERQIGDLPDDIVGRVLGRMEPYLMSLPTGHSIGHISRDYSNLTSVLHDPRTAAYSDAEVLCGIFGGTLHDIGNSILDKNTERGRLAKHAELGAWLVGQQLADLLPPDILDITQLAIAAHTKFKDPQTVVRDGQVIGQREPYQTQVTEDELKRALALTRSACRTDIQSIIMIMRQTPVAMRARDLYLATGALRTAEADDRANITKLFTLDMANPDGLLPYFQEITDNTRTRNWHTIDDTQYLTNELFGKNVGAIQTFIDAVREGPAVDIADPQESFDRFLNLCYLLEPGSDVDTTTANARRGFALLDPRIQQHWAHGYDLIVEQLYPEYHARMQGHVETLPPFVQGRDRKMQAIVTDVHKRAGRVLNALDPELVEKDPSEFPSLAEALVV